MMCVSHTQRQPESGCEREMDVCMVALIENAENEIQCNYCHTQNNYRTWGLIHAQTHTELRS